MLTNIKTINCKGKIDNVDMAGHMIGNISLLIIEHVEDVKIISYRILQRMLKVEKI